jgi:phytoene/squalene synthetase
MDTYNDTSCLLATKITRTASKQTYFTIQLLVDRERIPDAFRAYAYFRWVDDRLDAETASPSERMSFLQRQQSILEDCYQGQPSGDLCPEERMLVDLVMGNPEKSGGLEAYLRDMMAVMAFDVERRGRAISAAELSEYSRLLATAVTEALHYFIGHNCCTPKDDTRYLAVRGAHVIHMLRDWQEDVEAGYFNIPQGYVQAHDLDLSDVDAPAFREWVRSRVHLARACFQHGREYTARVKNLRCRLAGYAYIARFEWMLYAIERDGYRLRAAYPERKSWRAGMWMLSRALTSAIGLQRTNFAPRKPVIQIVKTNQR